MNMQGLVTYRAKHSLMAEIDQKTNASGCEPNQAGHMDSSPLAATMTQAASTQTYYTIRYLADRPLIADAYLLA
jgi:hypothetical protein